MERWGVLPQGLMITISSDRTGTQPRPENQGLADDEYLTTIKTERVWDMYLGYYVPDPLVKGTLCLIGPLYVES